MCKAEYCNESDIKTLKAEPKEVRNKILHQELRLYELDELITITLNSIIKEGILENLIRLGTNKPTEDIDKCLAYLEIFNESVKDIKCDYDTETIEIKSRLKSRIKDIDNILSNIKNM